MLLILVKRIKSVIVIGNLHLDYFGLSRHLYQHIHKHLGRQQG